MREMRLSVAMYDEDTESVAIDDNMSEELKQRIIQEEIWSQTEWPQDELSLADLFHEYKNTMHGKTAYCEHGYYLNPSVNPKLEPTRKCTFHCGNKPDINLEELDIEREKACIDKAELFDFYHGIYDSLVDEIKKLRAK